MSRLLTHHLVSLLLAAGLDTYIEDGRMRSAMLKHLEHRMIRSLMSWMADARFSALFWGSLSR